MAELVQPAEIAREVLRRLAMQRTPPTPENYLRLYHEIAGTTAAEIFPEKSLKILAAALPRATPEQTRFARNLDAAVSEKSWEALKAALLALTAAAGAEPPQWSALIHELVLQLERTHVGLTPAKKREVLDHVLKSSNAPELLFSRLQSLLRSWSQGPTAEAEESLVEGEAGVRVEARAGAAETPLASEWRELLAQVLENSLSQLLSDNPALIEEAAKLAAAVRAARNSDDIARLGGQMKKFSYRLNFVAEDQAELRTALLHVLHLLIENIGELAIDDQYLHGQIAVLLELTGQPLNLRRLDDVERRLKDVIYKQGALKKQLHDAQDRMKAMLASFVDRLAEFSDTTSGYHDKIERCAEQISRASDISQLSDVLAVVMQETRAIQLNAQRSRDELCEMRRRVEETEKEVGRLQHELAETSEMVRMDPLTGALNRKGMDDALEREVARAMRHQAMLCLGLLDVDNFKKLNDTYGHHAGDEALKHLAAVIRETLRPQDTLARYGGEEFLILLPDTTLDAAVQTLTRLQRELTRKYFLHENQKMLITFSAGAAELGPQEAAADAVKRADAAMYLAKRAGKNRVVAA
ncbi:diguanylate cyclase DosC [mine drainage metagenome]|uniref:Diguanylate cyclase DosC n=1 Tax=mine drainage metagenome TaxID=410659 RepID=A0A1J5RF33_9ZZZZ